MFVCDQCGLCCQSLAGNELYKDLDAGNGICKYYDRASHLCSIYYERPEKCNVDAMYRHFSEQLTYEEYIKLNEAACKRLKEAHEDGK